MAGLGRRMRAEQAMEARGLMNRNDSAPGFVRRVKESVKRKVRTAPRRRYSARGGELNLKAGDLVEVRSREEILSTLDERGRFENLPFMPEMLEYCGKRLRVYKRADKTCDNIGPWSIRRVKSTVHLENARCDGAGHDECEAGCLLFWKEAWLKPAEPDTVSEDSLYQPRPESKEMTGLCTVDGILAATRALNAEREVVYSCQATEVLSFTSPMAWWDIRQYIRDIRSGNLLSGLSSETRTEHVLEWILGILQVLRAVIIPIFNRVQSKIDAPHYPFIAGTLTKTPFEALDLEPGELVQVRSKEEIMATLNAQNRNRGLLFDSEMLRYCGGIYRVIRRVNHIIDEKTGKMMDMKYPCIVLEGVFCQSDYHRLCPRAIYSYWRENWLRRVSSSELEAAAQTQDVGTCRTR